MNIREILIIVLTALVVISIILSVKKICLTENKKMIKTVLKIEGMRCGMCEAHICDVIRKCCYVKKVTASHVKNEAVIESETSIDKEALKTAIENTGYKVGEITEEEYKKKGLFGFLKK